MDKRSCFTNVCVMALIALAPSVCIPASTAKTAKPVAKPAAKPISLSKPANTISYIVVKAKKSTKNADYSYSYPKFSGIPAGTVWALNKFVAKEVADSQPNSKEERGNPDLRNSHDLSIEVRQFGSFLSLATSGYDFTGGAHGNTGLAYDLYTLQPFHKLSLRDLLAEEVNYAVIADLCQIKLYQTLTNGGKDFVQSGTEAKADDFSTFYVGKDGITFVFQQYQVAPYSEGMPEATITWSELKPLVKPSSPVYTFTKTAQPSDVAISPEKRNKLKAAALAAFEKRIANQ